MIPFNYFMLISPWNYIFLPLIGKNEKQMNRRIRKVGVACVRLCQGAPETLPFPDRDI